MAEQQIALVTGASRSGAIGLEVCRQLAVLGFSLIQGTRDLDKGQAAAATLASEGITLLTRQLDVTDPQSIEQLRAQVEMQFGKLDVLVNNAAGYTDWSELPADADMGNAHAVLETTLFGAWRMYQAFLPLLRKSAHGRVVNVSSGAGSHGDSQFGLVATGASAPSYGISKAALNALTVKLAAEVRDSHILVNAVCPGLTATYPGAESMGARPLHEGAASVVWAVTLPDDGPTGGFFRDGKPLPW